MIVCPSCDKMNGDGRRHCNWCGCYLPPLLREEDRATPWVPNTWSGMAMLRTEKELERRMNYATATVLYDDMQEQILVCGNGNIVRVIR